MFRSSLGSGFRLGAVVPSGVTVRARVGEGRFVPVGAPPGQGSSSVFRRRAAATLVARRAQRVADRSASHAGSRHASSGPGRHARRREVVSLANASAPRRRSSYGLAATTRRPEDRERQKSDLRELTAAHRTLLFGTRVVTNVATGQSRRSGHRPGPFSPTCRRHLARCRRNVGNCRSRRGEGRRTACYGSRSTDRR
jgi:hypothetical protein